MGELASLGDVVEKAHTEDPDGPHRTALAEAAAVVGRVLGPAVSTLNPEVIVVGGAFGGGDYDLIADGLLAGLKETAFPAAFDAVTLRTGKGRNAPQPSAPCR